MDTQALSLDMKSLRVGGQLSTSLAQISLVDIIHLHLHLSIIFETYHSTGQFLLVGRRVIKCPTSAEATEATSILQHEWDLFGEDTLAKESAIMRPFRCVELEEWSSLALVYPDDDLRPLAHVYKGRFGVALPNYDHISGYLMKPIQSSRLIQTIKAALNSTEEEP